MRFIAIYYCLHDGKIVYKYKRSNNLNLFDYSYTNIMALLTFLTFKTRDLT